MLNSNGRFGALPEQNVTHFLEQVCLNDQSGSVWMTKAGVQATCFNGRLRADLKPRYPCRAVEFSPQKSANVTGSLHNIVPSMDVDRNHPCRKQCQTTSERYVVLLQQWIIYIMVLHCFFLLGKQLEKKTLVFKQWSRAMTKACICSAWQSVTFANQVAQSWGPRWGNSLALM